MKYQCIDCKVEFVGERKVCPQCKSRFIIFVEQGERENIESASPMVRDEQPAAGHQQAEDVAIEAQANLRQGDLIKVIESVALLKMNVGNCYKVASIKMDYYEKIYCLSPCDENGVIDKGTTREIPARSLDYWLDTDNISVLGS